jgi:hypothetical protein
VDSWSGLGILFNNQQRTTNHAPTNNYEAIANLTAHSLKMRNQKIGGERGKELILLLPPPTSLSASYCPLPNFLACLASNHGGITITATTISNAPIAN